MSMSVPRGLAATLGLLVLLACGGSTEPGDGGGGGGGGGGSAFSGDSLTSAGYALWWRALALARTNAPLPLAQSVLRPLTAGVTWNCPAGGTARDSVAVFASSPPRRKFYAASPDDATLDSVRILVTFTGCRVSIDGRTLEFSTLTPLTFSAGASRSGDAFLVREVVTYPGYAASAVHTIRAPVASLAPYQVTGTLSYLRTTDSIPIVCPVAVQLAAGPMDFRLHESAWDGGWRLPFASFVGTDASGSICGRAATTAWVTAGDSLSSAEAEAVIGALLAGGMTTWDTAAADRRPDWGAVSWDSTYAGADVHSPSGALVRTALDEGGSCASGGHRTNYTLSQRLSPSDTEVRWRGYGFGDCAVAGIRIWGGILERTEFTLGTGSGVSTASVAGADTGRFAFRTADGRLGRCVVALQRAGATLSGTVCGRTVSGLAAPDGVGALNDVPRVTVYDGISQGFAAASTQPFYHSLLVRRVRTGIASGFRQGVVIYSTSPGCCGVPLQTAGVLDWSLTRADNGQVFGLFARRASAEAIAPGTYPVDYDLTNLSDPGSDSVYTSATETGDYAIAYTPTLGWASRAGSLTLGTPTWDGAAVACPALPGITYGGSCTVQYGTVEVSYSGVEMWSGGTLNDPAEILRRTAGLTATVLPAIRVVETN